VRSTTAVPQLTFGMVERPAYPSDLSDARWALIAPRLAAWRQARDYKAPPDNSASMIRIAMIDNLTRRITNETTPTWRDI